MTSLDYDGTIYRQSPADDLRAACLELALRRNLPITTLDGELQDALQAEQIELLGK